MVLIFYKVFVAFNLAYKSVLISPVRGARGRDAIFLSKFERVASDKGGGFEQVDEHRAMFQCF